MSKKHKTTYKYYIILFCNKKKKRVIHKSAKRTTIMEVWRELKTQEKPYYTKKTSGKKRTELNFELALIYPHTRWSTKTYTKDGMGRNVEIKLNNEKLRIKEIIPYWEEELIYDFDAKERIRFHEMIKSISEIEEISQIFTLNNKIFVQNENLIKMYSNKNIDDTSRLFEIIKTELIKKKKNNYIYVRDITTHQRILLYDLLESKGYNRRELIKHYSY